MTTVINVARLTLLIGSGILYFLGLGGLAIVPATRRSVQSRLSDSPLLRVVPLALLAGLILNYCILLVLGSLRAATYIGLAGSLAGLWLLTGFLRHRSWRRVSASALARWGAVCAVSIICLIPIYSVPLQDWDARSIWFFHAKMIYTAGSIGKAAGWQHPAAAFSFPYYPPFVPAIAAQLAYVAGFWNEYAPKLCLVFLLVPASMWLAGFLRTSLSSTLLAVLFPWMFSRWLWNGYMDAYLALYFACALLLIGRYMTSAEVDDLLAGLGCLTLILYVKNEGTLAAIAGLCALLVLAAAHRRLPSPRSILSLPWKPALLGIMELVPFVLWILYKQQWALPGQYGLGSRDAFIRMVGRWTDGSYMLILQAVYSQIEGGLVALALLLGAASAWTSWRSLRAGMPALFASVVYCFGVAVVYMLTPYDLSWQLSTSIDRTMLPVLAGLFVACYAVMDAQEKSYEAHIASNDQSTHRVHDAPLSGLPPA